MWGYLAAGLFALWLYRCEQFKLTPIARNPRRRQNPGTLTPADKATLTRAETLAAEFHGEAGYRQVIELGKRERTLPRFLVGLGEMPEVQYEPGRGSKRQEYVWQHRAGDLGFGQQEAAGRPVLAVDPNTRRPVIVAMRSSMKLDSQRGLVG